MPTNNLRGFTLIEIAIALGIFSFAIIGVIFLLGTGLTSTKDTQRDSSLSSALAASAALLRSGTVPLSATTNLFDMQGSLVTDPTKAYYRFTVAPLAPGGSLSTNLVLYSVQVSGPYPRTNSFGSFVLSRPKP